MTHQDETKKWMHKQNKAKSNLGNIKQNRIKDHKNIKCSQGGYIFFTIVRLHSEGKKVLNFY